MLTPQPPTDATWWRLCSGIFHLAAVLDALYPGAKLAAPSVTQVAAERFVPQRSHCTPRYSPKYRAETLTDSRFDRFLNALVKSESTFQKKAFHAIRDIDGATKVVATRAGSGPATTRVAY